MRPELARALAAAHIHRDEDRFQGVIREIIVNERDPLEIEKWRSLLQRKAEADAKPKAATLLDGKLTLVEPVKLEDVVLDDATRSSVTSWVREMRWRDALNARGIPVRNTALFHGATGTGKTMLSSAIGASLGLPCYSARTADIIGPHVGESSKGIAAIVKQARAVPMVLVIDEVDSIATDRASLDGQSASVENARTTNVFLQELDRGLDLSILVGTTNLFTKVDSAIRRRLTFQVEFPAPSRAQVVAFMSRVAARFGLERHYAEGPLSYAEAVHAALSDVRDTVITELENAK